MVSEDQTQTLILVENYFISWATSSSSGEEKMGLKEGTLGRKIQASNLQEISGGLNSMTSILSGLWWVWLAAAQSPGE